MATTFEENEEIRKAEEDKLYGENPESKTIQAQREALQKEEAERASFLEETLAKKTYSAGEDPEDGKRERIVSFPVLAANGNYQLDENGEVVYAAYTIVDPPNTLNALMVGSFNVEDFYNNFVRQDNKKTWPAEGTSLDVNSTTGEILDYLKEYGPYKIGKNKDGSTGDTVDLLIFDPVWMAQGELPNWRDLLSTLSQEMETVNSNLQEEKNELAQLKDKQDIDLEAIQQINAVIAAAEEAKVALEAYITQLEDEVENARNTRDTFPVGSPEWNAANVVFLGKQATLAEQQALLAGVEATLVQRKAERDEFEIDLNTTEDRLAIVQSLVDTNTITYFNLSSAWIELRASIDIADTWQKKILNAYPKIEQEYKLHKEVMKTLEERQVGIQNDLKTLTKKESDIRLGIHNAQGAAAVGVGEGIVGDLGPLNAAGQPISPTGAIGAAFKKSQDVAAQLNKPVYTEAELKEIARQNASADELHKYRAKRTDKGKMGFSGCDITAVLRVPGYSRGKTSLSENLIFQLGTLQTIAISTYNSKTPVKSIGFKNPIAVARGGRTIAGTMIFNQLHRHVFDDNAYGEVVNDDSGFLTYSQGDTQYFISSQEIRNQNEDPYAWSIANAEENKKANQSEFSQTELRNKVERFKPGTANESFKPKQYDYVSFQPRKYTTVRGPWAPADEAYLAELRKLQKSWQNNKTKGYLSDANIKDKTYINKKKLKKQWDFSWDTSLVGERVKPSDLPPFDIIIMLVNEMGNLGKIILYGVEIIHDSQTLSVEDIYTEAQYQYIAKDIEYFHADDFAETKAWVSNLPKYGYKGFYLSNIERAQAELHKLKDGIAQSAFDAAQELKQESIDIGKAMAAEQEAKTLAIDMLKEEIAALEKELERFSNSSNASTVEALQKLLWDTQALVSAKVIEIETSFENAEDFKNWRIQNKNTKERAKQLRDRIGWYQTQPGLVVRDASRQVSLDEDLLKWEEYLNSINECFFDDLDSPDPNSTFLAIPATRGNKAKIVYEYFYEERVKSEANLAIALNTFKNGDAEGDGYVAFWDKIIARNWVIQPAPDALYPKRGVEAKKRLAEYEERFAAYYTFKKQRQALEARIKNHSAELKEIFDASPVNTPYPDIIINLKKIIQNEIGPISWPQYTYVFYLDESKLEQANKELEAKGSNPKSLEGLNKVLVRMNGRWIANAERAVQDATPGGFLFDMIDWTTPGILVNTPRLPYETTDAAAAGPRATWGPGGKNISQLPTYLKMTEAGQKDAKWEEVKLSYEYIPVYSPPTKSSKKAEAFAAYVAKLDEYTNVFDYLNKSYNWAPDLDSRPTLAKSSWLPVFGENPENNKILKMKVTEFFKFMLDAETESFKLTLNAESPEMPLEIRQYFFFKDRFFTKGYMEYRRLLQDWDFERIENNIQVAERPPSYTDLKNKADFYEWALMGALNSETSEVKSAKIAAILDKIKEKRREIALINSGEYDGKKEQERTNLLSNTESGPTSFGNGVQAVPPSPRFAPATSVPSQPAATSPAPEQTQTVTPPKKM